eukprot:scaffold235656_cov22-Tisochrysis_lutea.AAC.1
MTARPHRDTTPLGAQVASRQAAQPQPSQRSGGEMRGDRLLAGVADNAPYARAHAREESALPDHLRRKSAAESVRVVGWVPEGVVTAAAAAPAPSHRKDQVGDRRCTCKRAASSALHCGEANGGVALRGIPASTAGVIPDTGGAAENRFARLPVRLCTQSPTGQMLSPSDNTALEGLIQRKLYKGEGQFASDRHAETGVEGSNPAAHRARACSGVTTSDAAYRSGDRPILADLHPLSDDRSGRPDKTRGGGRHHCRGSVT